MTQDWETHMTDDELARVGELHVMVKQWSDWIKAARAEIRLIRDRCRKRKARAKRADWSKIKSPMDRQKQAFDDLISDSARLMVAMPVYKRTHDFVQAVRRKRYKPVRQLGTGK